MVEESTQLLKYLLNILSHRSRNSVKSLLSRGQVAVNGQTETAYNYQLQPGQMVEIIPNSVSKKQPIFQGVKILHEDEDIIVIEKSSGLLSVSSPKEKRKTAHHQLMNHVRSTNPGGRIFVVHRLDRDTSGVMMFAKSEKIKHQLQNSWRSVVKERTYIALVEGKVKQAKGTITSWLKESSALRMHSSTKPNEGQHAVTHYKRLQSNQFFSLLEIQLETGRKNQIRVHMEDLGHSIADDKKYGAVKKGIGRLGLHASVLSFTHPSSGKVMRFTVDPPDVFITKSK
ncbi:RluA family pseudouridine synthase [Halobacillus seohaensis]|uniref:Pseudouridine synthase n=1 Tax=Halobacillus seohaensis TaxID=447421 RepID=A0ABW2EF25_9BACI